MDTQTNCLGRDCLLVKENKNNGVNKTSSVKIDIKKELDKLKSETLRNLKEILCEIEKIA